MNNSGLTKLLDPTQIFPVNADLFPFCWPGPDSI